MTPTSQGSFRLFNFRGIDVHVHFTWFIIAVYSVSTRVPNYASPIWALFEYLTLFLVVLLHEFGHALACRQVGGSANQIVLWPLGGVAYVAPPSRPGATLWSIAAGPLVNVALLPVFYGIYYVFKVTDAFPQHADLYRFLRAIIFMDLSLLVFNLLPVYPLDGGQILRSLLWYPFGRTRSLLAATVVGFVGGAGIIALAVWWQSLWLGIMALFLLSGCWQAFKQARAMRQLDQLPRRSEFKCPECAAHPPIGRYWLCAGCRQPFDPFASAATCPQCAAVLDLTACPDCQSAHAHRSWDGTIRDT